MSNQTLALIVIGESEVRERVARELARADCLVYACSRFEQGREVLDRLRPDILVADVRLEEYNGLSLVLRANAHSPRTTTIIYTRYDDPVLRREAHRNGAAFVVDAGLSEGLRSSCRPEPLAGTFRLSSLSLTIVAEMAAYARCNRWIG